jgi:hypothetical protein
LPAQLFQEVGRRIPARRRRAVMWYVGAAAAAFAPQWLFQY